MYHMDPYGTHMGPMWAHVDPHEPIWTRMDPHGTHMDPYRTQMDPSLIVTEWGWLRACSWGVGAWRFSLGVASRQEPPGQLWVSHRSWPHCHTPPPPLAPVQGRLGAHMSSCPPYPGPLICTRSRHETIMCTTLWHTLFLLTSTCATLWHTSAPHGDC